jgi:hypothetical protein
MSFIENDCVKSVYPSDLCILKSLGYINAVPGMRGVTHCDAQIILNA